MELDLKNTTHSLVDAGLRDFTCFYLRHHVVKQRQPVFGHHDHIDAGINRLCTIIGFASGYLTDPVPITDDETIEPQLVAEHGRQQFLIAMNFFPVPAIERGHHRHHARLNGCDVALPMDGQQIRFAKTGIPLINTPVCPTIADEVLGSCHYAIALHGLNHATGKLADEGWVGTVGFIGTTPSGVLRHR